MYNSFLISTSQLTDSPHLDTQDLGRIVLKIRYSFDVAASHQNRTVHRRPMAPLLYHHYCAGLDSQRHLQVLSCYHLLLPSEVNGHWRVYSSTSSMGLQLVSTRLGEAQCRSATKECILQEQYVQ